MSEAKKVLSALVEEIEAQEARAEAAKKQLADTTWRLDEAKRAYQENVKLIARQHREIEGMNGTIAAMKAEHYQIVAKLERRLIKLTAPREAEENRRKLEGELRAETAEKQLAEAQARIEALETELKEERLHHLDLLSTVAKRDEETLRLLAELKQKIEG